jgi:hypothetical protein
LDIINIIIVYYLYVFLRKNLPDRAHNPKVGGSNPAPATKQNQGPRCFPEPFLYALKNPSALHLVQHRSNNLGSPKLRAPLEKEKFLTKSLKKSYNDLRSGKRGPEPHNLHPAKSANKLIAADLRIVMWGNF